MRKYFQKFLAGVALSNAGLVFIGIDSAYGAQTCTFSTGSAHYGHLGQFGPAEPLKFTWDVATGRVIHFSWQHAGADVFSFAASPGAVKQDVNYHHLELGITQKGYEKTRYSLRGYLATNVSLPRTSFAAIYEGTGTTWFVAHGELHCN